MTSLPAALADHYRIERELGRGGMATVYLAHDLKHDRRVALKVLHGDLAATLGPERFQREIRFAARLQHPHVLTVLDSGEAGGHLWFTMPYVEGESLRERLRRERQLPLDEAVRIAREAAQALQYAHEHDVLHRDIKPENILLTLDGNTLVADFGVARALGAEETLTQTGLTVGTPAYMSPEQAAGERSLDARSDVYSLGCVLYEILAGEAPFTGPTAQAILAKRFSTSPISLRATRPELPEDVDQAVLRALARAPADRFASAAEFGEALRSGATTPAATRVGASPVLVRARRFPAWLAFVLGIAVMASTAMLVLRHRSDRVSASGASDGSPKSIAVLPLQNLGGDTTDQYFSDGISQEILGALGAVPGLLVAGRTSSFRYRGRDLDPTTIGRQLGVGSLLTGTLQRNGGAVRVSVEVVDTRTGYQLWSGKYDRSAADVFAVEDEIATAVAGALSVKLMGAARLVRRSSVNPTVHDLTLRAAQQTQRGDSAGFYQAVTLYQQALVLDSTYAPAWAGLADAYTWIADGYEAPKTAVPTIKMAALRAAALDDSLASPHYLLAEVADAWEWDYALAAAEYRKALSLDPNAPEIHLWYGEFLEIVAQDFDAAEREMNRAATRDPLNPQIVFYLIVVAIRQQKFDHALALTKRLEELIGRPRFYENQMVAWIHETRGEWDKCVAATGPEDRVQRAICEAHLERPDSARQVIRELEEARHTGYVDGTHIAVLHAALGETDAALDWLERAAEDHSANVRAVRIDSRITPEIRASPRYAKLLRTIGLPPKGLPPGVVLP